MRLRHTARPRLESMEDRLALSSMTVHVAPVAEVRATEVRATEVRATEVRATEARAAHELKLEARYALHHPNHHATAQRHHAITRTQVSPNPKAAPTNILSQFWHSVFP